MFTGIIRYIGTIRQVRPTSTGRRLALDIGPLAQGVRLGDSIAVNGACLTVCALDGEQADFDVVAETLDRTTLGDLAAGSKVNLENALRLGDALDGHLVQGHIDALATVREIRAAGACEIEFTGPRELLGQMVTKGSVAINGVSLTLAEVSDDAFRVAIIPTTLRETTLGLLRRGDRVNIETDVIGKYVQKYLGQAPAAPAGGNSGGLTIEKLKQAGFI